MSWLFRKALAKLVAFVWYRRRFSAFGAGSFIIAPIAILNPRYISIGRNVRVRNGLRLEAIDTLRRPTLEIGDNCNIEQDVHIVCSSEIVIGRNCSITARCAIVDTSHPFDGIGNRKIGDQLNTEAAIVHIGDDCFLGIGAVILPNVRLGRRCVVGSNAVVLAGDYPDGSVIVGVPARIIRQIQT